MYQGLYRALKSDGWWGKEEVEVSGGGRGFIYSSTISTVWPESVTRYSRVHYGSS
jgi:hypothetical protein